MRSIDELLSARQHGVVATIRRDGRPYLATVAHVYDPAERVLSIGVHDTSVKARNLRRDPRASYHVAAPDSRTWLVAEGTAWLSPPTDDPDSALCDDYFETFKVLGGAEDEDAYRRMVVAGRHVILRIKIERTYGWPA
jgi:PPOX class probable F420-dependent enzyme